MKKPLIIFGSGDLAQLAHYYFSTDSDFEVVAFTLDAEYIETPDCCGLPVVAFEQVAYDYPPDVHTMFVALGYSRLNQVRKQKYLAAKSLG